jgi:hypothetical protein
MTRPLLKTIDQLTPSEFFSQFPDEDACKRYLMRCRWPDGVRCPRCGNDDLYDASSFKKDAATPCVMEHGAATGSGARTQPAGHRSERLATGFAGSSLCRLTKAARGCRQRRHCSQYGR